jgi:hypothetical protein
LEDQQGEHGDRLIDPGTGGKKNEDGGWKMEAGGRRNGSTVRDMAEAV